MPAGLTGLQGNSNQRKKSGGGGRLSRLTTEDQGCGSQCSLSLLPPSPAWPVGEWTFLDARLFSLAWRLLRACVHPGLRLGWNIVRAGCRWGVPCSALKGETVPDSLPAYRRRGHLQSKGGTHRGAADTWPGGPCSRRPCPGVPCPEGRFSPARSPRPHLQCPRWRCCRSATASGRRRRPPC